MISNIMKYLCIFIAIIFVTLINHSLAVADLNRSVITDYFEGGAVVGKFEYEDNTDGTGLLINYYSPSLKKTLTYSVAKFDECSTMGMYSLPNTHQIVIDGSCSSQGGQIFAYVYEWSDIKKNWCLAREITGEKEDITSGKISPSVQVSRIKGCSILGETGPYLHEPRITVIKKIATELGQFRTLTGTPEKLKAYFLSIPSYSIFELADYINSSNVQNTNDFAFYLSESGRSFDAIPILENIVEKFPKRVVAKLNLADTYWDNGYKEQSSILYKQYCDEMFSINLGEKIPGRVFNRIKVVR